MLSSTSRRDLTGINLGAEGSTVLWVHDIAVRNHLKERRSYNGLDGVVTIMAYDFFEGTDTNRAQQ